MRVKTGIVRHRKHKKVLKQVKGFRLSAKVSVKKAKERLLHAGQHAYADRKKKKRSMRSLWIERLSGALTSLNPSTSTFVGAIHESPSDETLHDSPSGETIHEPPTLNYSRFMAGLKRNNININRKILSEIAIVDPEVFSLIAKKSRE